MEKYAFQFYMHPELINLMNKKKKMKNGPPYLHPLTLLSLLSPCFLTPISILLQILMQQNILEIALKIFKKKLEEWPKSHWNKLNDFMKKNIHFNKKKINSQEKNLKKKLHGFKTNY
jgi:ribosomal protein S21